MKYIYVLDQNGNPMMPCHSYKRVKKWLKNNEVKIINYKPFTVQFLREIKNVKQKCILGIDPGRTNIGICVIDENGNELFSANVETRNKKIKSLMDDRRNFRQIRRHYRRNKRKRRFLKFHLACKTKSIPRYLPHYKKPVVCKVFKNKESKFCNRIKPQGWLTPTALQLLRTHINIVKKTQKFLPITDIVLEINKFDFAKMENPNIKNWEYQKGRLFNTNINEIISKQQNNHCLFCNHKIEDIHHVIWKSKGGSNSIDNLAGVCKKHHNLIHTNKEFDAKCKNKKQGLLKKYHALSVINQIMKQLIIQLNQILPLQITTGYETKLTRETFNLNKEHYIDAYCIALSILNTKQISNIDNFYQIKQFRRHDRQINHRMLDRNYLLDNKVVCKNRHKRLGQHDISLEEYSRQYPENVLKLKVRKGYSVHKNLNRIKPGAVFLYQNKRYVIEGTSHGTHILNKNIDKGFVRIDKCKIIKHNEGLVFL